MLWSVVVCGIGGSSRSAGQMMLRYIAVSGPSINKRGRTVTK